MKAPSCEDRISKATSKSILVRPGGLSSGFGLVNQLRWIGSQTLRACYKNASLIQAGFVPDAFSKNIPPIPVSTVFDEDAFNKKLLTIPICKHTQLLPRSCVHTLSKLQRTFKLDVECIDEVGFANFGVLTNFLKPRLLGGSEWQSSTGQLSLKKPYVVVHLNIDCDWLLFSVWSRESAMLSKNWSSVENVSSRRQIFQRYRKNPHEREELTRKYCSGDGEADNLTTLMARRMIQLFSDAVNMHTSLQQVLVATSIGKQSNLTKWILSEFTSNIINRTVSTGRASGFRYTRELDAVSELRVSSNAAEGVGLDRSTFWEFAAQKIKRNRGSTFTIKLCDQRGIDTGAPACEL
jgi:hypothetical protein